jgi:WD40 repeat protein
LDLNAKDPAASPVVLRGHMGPLKVLGITHDSHWLVTGSDDHTARIWDLTTKDPAAGPIVLNGHEEAVSAVGISADNHWLLTVSNDSRLF